MANPDQPGHGEPSVNQPPQAIQPETTTSRPPPQTAIRSEKMQGKTVDTDAEPPLWAHSLIENMVQINNTLFEFKNRLESLEQAQNTGTYYPAVPGPKVFHPEISQHPRDEKSKKLTSGDVRNNADPMPEDPPVIPDTHPFMSLPAQQSRPFHTLPGPRLANRNLDILAMIPPGIEPLDYETPEAIARVRDIWPSVIADVSMDGRKDSAKIDWRAFMNSVGPIQFSSLRDPTALATLDLIQSQLYSSQVPYRQWPIHLQTFLKDDFIDCFHFIRKTRCSWLYAVEAVLTTLSVDNCLYYNRQAWDQFRPEWSEGTMNTLRRWRQTALNLPQGDLYGHSIFANAIMKVNDWFPELASYYHLTPTDMRPRHAPELFSWLLRTADQVERGEAAKRVFYGQPAGNLDIAGTRYKYDGREPERVERQPISTITSKMFGANSLSSANPAGFAPMRIADPFTDDTKVMATRDMSDVACYRCQRNGHFAHQCFAKTTKDGEPLSSPTKGDGHNGKQDDKSTKMTKFRTTRDKPSYKNFSKPRHDRNTRTKRAQKTRAHVTHDKSPSDSDEDNDDDNDDLSSADDDSNSEDDPLNAFLTRAADNDQQ